MYIMYNVYMDQEEYTVAEFRDNLRVALDRADNDLDVYISRHGKRYYLCTEEFFKELLKKDPEVESLPEATIENVLARALPDFSKRVVEKSEGFCKNGHPFARGRDRCMGKGCKYS
jgi:hypothetical protein